MKLAGKVAALCLALSLFSAPLAACILSNDTSTTEERECCRKMAEQCGRMEMPSSHSCCTTTLRGSDPYLATPGTSASALHNDVSAVLPVQAIAVKASALAWAFLLSNAHAPPKPPPGSVSILRI